MKKMILWIFLAVASGGLLGKFTFDKYENFEIENTFKINTEVYALFYGSFNSEEEMKNKTTNLERYIFLSNDNIFDVYIALSVKEDNINKVKQLYDKKNIKSNIVKININHDEFIQNITEYEKLLSATEDEKSLFIIENQILSCYEDLVVNYE